MNHKINIRFKVVGGPHDDAEGTYNGESKFSEEIVLKESEKMEMNGHIYRVVDRDLDSKTLTLMY